MRGREKNGWRKRIDSQQFPDFRDFLSRRRDHSPPPAVVPIILNNLQNTQGLWGLIFTVLSSHFFPPQRCLSQKIPIYPYPYFFRVHQSLRCLPHPDFLFSIDPRLEKAAAQRCPQAFYGSVPDFFSCLSHWCAGTRGQYSRTHSFRPQHDFLNPCQLVVCAIY